MLIVDDALLLAIIAQREVDGIEPFVAQVRQGEVFTTGSWYWRLTRAVNSAGLGALSRQLSSLKEQQRQLVRSSLAALPAEIGLLSLRRLVPVMSALDGNLNLLTAEAIAPAVVLEAEIAVTTNAPLLMNAAKSVGVSVRIVSLQ